MSGTVTSKKTESEKIREDVSRQAVSYLENILTRQVERVRSYDLDGAMLLADEVNELAENIGSEGILGRSEFAAEAKRRYNVDLTATTAASDADKARLIADADVVFCTAKAGVQVLNASVLSDAKQLKVAGDVNAVPPLGIEGIKLMDSGAPLIYAINSKDAVAVGALAVGNVKYHLQHELLRQTLDSDRPVYLDFRDAFENARKLV